MQTGDKLEVTHEYMSEETQLMQTLKHMCTAW